MKPASEMTREELLERNAELEHKVGGSLGPIGFKVGDKGGVSVSGLGQRFPTTLYAESWLYLLEHADELRDFIEHNQGRLKHKPKKG